MNDQAAVVRVCTFSGASSLPILMGVELGLFAENGLSVELNLTRSSRKLMEGLLGGRFDVVHAAPDNYIEWRDRTGEPIVAWIGGTSGPISLVAEPSVRQARQLAGRRIAVDAVTSGFVSILRRMLRTAGLDANAVELVPLGATELRFQALREGRADATMLTLPWSLLAAEDGFPILAQHHEVIPRLQGSCGGSLAGWLDAHPDEADSYLRSICAALTWLHLPGHGEPTNRFVADRYGMEPVHADRVRRAILDPVTGWPPSALVDPVGIELVCELRRENGQPPKEPPWSYVTLEPYRRVMGFGLVEP